MNYLSVCSGIEAASVAWEPLGFKPVGFSETEKFPAQVLAHRFPGTRNYGDMTMYKEWKINESIDILAGGTPCQSFSVAGLRKGLEDLRGNLMLTFLAIADRLRPRWIVWENVPGVLSSNGGKDFGSFLGALADLGYGWAYRVLDAQWFGVAQRRRRVFVVGCLGDAGSAAKVLFECESVRRDPAPSSEKGKGFAGNVAPSLTASNNPSRSPQSSEVTQQVNAILKATCLQSSDASSFEGERLVVGSLDTECGLGKLTHQSILNGHITWTTRPHETPVILQSIAFEPGIATREGGRSRFTEGVTGTLRADAGDNQLAVAFTAAEARRSGTIRGSETVPTLTSQTKSEDTEPCVFTKSQVRRLTPMECERLQGLPDGWTDIKMGGKPTPDGPRYKAIGNSMAVPVMRWIGERIHARESDLGEADSSGGTEKVTG